MNYRVNVSEPAEADADDIYRWLQERSPAGARDWWSVFLETLERLKEHPQGLGLAPEADAFGEPLRQVLFKTSKGNTYRILFIVRSNSVHVLRVRGSGQNLVSPVDIEIPDREDP